MGRLSYIDENVKLFWSPGKAGGLPRLVTRHGGRIVGSILQTKSGGALVGLPWINFYRKEFKKDEAVGWGKKYLKTLESLDKAIRSQIGTTPVPQWARDDKFRTNREIALSEELVQIQTEISTLEKKRETVKEKLTDAGFLKGLLTFGASFGVG